MKVGLRLDLRAEGVSNGLLTLQELDTRQKQIFKQEWHNRRAAETAERSPKGERRESIHMRRKT